MKLRSIAAAAAIMSLAATAKDLKTEITVDRTIVPVEREAVRLGSLTPQLLSSPAKTRKLSLADYTTPASLTRTLSVLEPAAYADTFALSPYRGYAALGYFPVFNLGASAGYNFIDKERTKLGAWLQYDGYTYKPSGDDASDGSYRNNTFTLGARFDQRAGEKSIFSADIAYSHAAIGLPDDFMTTSQNANTFDGKLSWWSRTGLIGYHVNAAYTYFGFGKDKNIPDANINAVSENRFTFNGGIGYYGSSAAPRGGIEIAADILSRSNGCEESMLQTGPDTFIPCVAPLSAGSLGVISLTPYYAFNGGRVHGRIGAKIELSTGGNDKKFHIAPAVMLDWNVASQFAIYANIEGGEHLNSLRSLFDYCPFMSSAWQYQRSHIPVTVDAGINIGPFTGFSARIFGGYAIANDWLMPQYTSLKANDGSFDINNGSFGAYDLRGWHVGAGLSYDWRSVIKVNVSAEVAPQDVEKGYYLWRDRAKYVISAGIEARPISKLKIDIGYELRGKRVNYAFDGVDYSEIDLKSVNNLSFDASYAIDETWSVFARGENLLNRRYNIITDIEAQGIKGLVGATYKF